MTGDRHVVGLVGQDEACRLVAVHEPPERFGLRRAAADNAVGPELEHVAESSDRDGVGLGLERAFLDGVRLVVEDDLVDFIQREARDLDRHVGEDQFLEFEFQFVEVPLPLLAEAIDGKPQRRAVRRLTDDPCACRERA